MPEPIVTFDEQAMRNDLRQLVRQAVEDALNGLLEEAMIERIIDYGHLIVFEGPTKRMEASPMVNKR